jgi:hypothetical protein
VGGWEKFQHQKGQKKKKKKKTGWGWGENKLAQKKKLSSGPRKGKQKKSTWDGKWIEKRILSVHHPSTLVHWWMWVTLALSIRWDCGFSWQTTVSTLYNHAIDDNFYCFW